MTADANPPSGGAEDAPRIISLLHRANDGFITLHRKNGQDQEDFENLGSVRGDKLENEWPNFRAGLDRDAYFSINSFFRPGHRSCEATRYLTACFVDVDYRDPDGLAAAILSPSTLQSPLPPPSLFCFSGRGLWPFWLLRDRRNKSLPPRSWPEKLRLYESIQEALKEALRQFGADAIDPARIVRVPGSINTKVNRAVRFEVRTDAAGNVIAYTLQSLAQALNVPLRSPRQHRRPKPHSKQRKAWEGLYAKRWRQFEKLRGMRSGFAEGCRNRAILIFIHILSRCGVSAAELHSAILRLGSECVPPLASRDCIRNIRNRDRYRRFSDQKIADWLIITLEESAKLGEDEKRGLGWPPASHFRLRAPDLQRPSARERREGRRSLIRNIVGTGSRPTVRAMQQHLDQYGYRVSIATIHKDYKALGYL